MIYYAIKKTEIPPLKKLAIAAACEFVKHDLQLENFDIIPVTTKKNIQDDMQPSFKTREAIAGKVLWNHNDANFIVIDQPIEEVIKTILHEARHRWQSVNFSIAKTQSVRDDYEQDAREYEVDSFRRFYHSESAQMMSSYFYSQYTPF